MTPAVPITALAAFAGAVLIAAGGWSLSRILGARSFGALQAADDPRSPRADLVSDEFGLIGRPDEIRRLSDGRLVPVEIKSRGAPASGVLPSHRVQVEAYCLLLESTTGRSPPHGIVVYAGGVRRIVRWDGDARREVLALLAQLRRPYDGSATPSPGKCGGCRWRGGCDARVG